VLIVVLKRFCWTASTRAKIDTIVNFPLTGLNLSSYIKGKPNVRYNAKSIVAHHGNGFVVVRSSITLLSLLFLTLLAACARDP